MLALPPPSMGGGGERSETEGVLAEVAPTVFCYYSSRFAATLPPVGKRVTGFSVVCGSLQHGYQRLTTICASLRSSKLCSLL